MPANPQVTDEMVEKAAIAANEAMLKWKAANGGDNASCIDCPDAIIVMACLTAALANHVVVPKEPTEAMINVGVEARWQSCVRDANSVYEIYRAMISAASPSVSQEG